MRANNSGFFVVVGISGIPAGWRSVEVTLRRSGDDPLLFRFSRVESVRSQIIFRSNDATPN